MRYADAGGVRIAYDDHGPRADVAALCLTGWWLNRGFFAALVERRPTPGHQAGLARARGLQSSTHRLQP